VRRYHPAVPFETRRPAIADTYVPMRLFVDILAHGGTSEASSTWSEDVHGS
jgi:hypothetical protein